MGCAASTGAVDLTCVVKPVNALASISRRRKGEVAVGELCVRKAEYTVSATTSSIVSESFALSSTPSGSDYCLNSAKWTVARPSPRSPPLRSGVRVKSKGNTEPNSLRKYQSGFGAFQGFCDLAEQLKSWELPIEPIAVPPLLFADPVAS